MDRIALVGCGLVGRAWAVTFARAGHEVAMWDAAEGAARAALEAIEPTLGPLAGQGLLRGSTPEEVRARIRIAADLADALAGAGHVQESAFEDLEVKRSLFADLDRLADPGAVLASSTSALLPSAFAGGLAGAGRCLVAHPINPPHLVPAVEIVPSPATAPATVERTAELMRSIGQVPIVLAREIDGFVVNRLQGALLQEAFRLVAEGYAGVDDVDAAVRDGLGLRWSFMGPFETIDLNAPRGVRDYVERFEDMYARMWRPDRVEWRGPVLDRVEAERSRRLARERLPARSAWRDRRLMALVAHRRREDEADTGEPGR